MTDHPRGVVIATFSQPQDAHIMQSLLASRDIPSELDGEYTIGANPLLSNAIGGVRLLVPPDHADTASKLLEECRRQRAEAQAERARTCPKCQSTNTRNIRESMIVGILAVITLGVLSLVFPYPRHKCIECGHKWR